MNRKGYFSWDSSLMEIVSAEQRVSKTTEKPYMVVKARMVFSGNVRSSPLERLAPKVYTMMCFKETLFPLFEAGNRHTFEGELSFDWGNTWLKILRLYDDSGNRLLRPEENENTSKFDEKIIDSIGKNIEDYVTKAIEESQDEKDGDSCTDMCWDCDHQNCDFFLPF